MEVTVPEGTVPSRGRGRSWKAEQQTPAPRGACILVQAPLLEAVTRPLQGHADR